MSSRKILVILLAAVFVIGAAGITHAVPGYLSSLTSACPGTGCTSCHGPSGPPLTAYGTSFSKIATHSSNPGGAIAAIGCPGAKPTPTPTPKPTPTPTPKPTPTPTPMPTPVACTGYTYSQWSACGSNGQQTRTVIGNTPAGCVGNPAIGAVLTQSCTPSPVACTSFTYGNWTACDSTGYQTRTAVGLPAGCTGTPDAAELSQACSYIPPVTPPPADQSMAVPDSAEVFSYMPLEQPVVSSDPAQARPIGVGPVATGGNTIDMKVNVGPFTGPVDVSLVIYAPTIDSDDLYFMNRNGELRRLSKAVDDEVEQSRSLGDTHSGDSEEYDQSTRPSKKFGRLVRWKDSNVTQVNEDLLSGPVTDLPSGVYTLVLVVRSHENSDNYYRWVTHVTIP